MEIIACLGWLVLLVIVLAFMCCLMPWWLVLLVVVVSIVTPLIPWNQPYINRSKAKRYKSRSDKQKKAEAKDVKDKTIINKTVNRTNTNISAGTSYQKNDDYDFDRYIAAKREEQAAYDDFIASLDMDN